MRVLLYTHALLWFFAGDNKLSQPAKTIIDDVEVTKLISIASIWEMTMAIGLNRVGHTPIHACGEFDLGQVDVSLLGKLSR